MRGFLLLIFIAIQLVPITGCGPDARGKWSAFGSKALGCAVQPMKAAVSGALDELVKLSTGGATDFKAMGVNLAATYGLPAALCAAEAAFSSFGGANAVPGASPPAAVAARWLVENKDAWADEAAKP